MSRAVRRIGIIAVLVLVVGVFAGCAILYRQNPYAGVMEW